MRGIYLLGGYPDRKIFMDCARRVSDAKFDFLEIGLPFNDPVADGPVIASAGAKALASGVTTEQILSDTIELAQLPIKKFIMTYANIPHALGIENFSQRLKGYIEGIIIPDLPNRMSGFFRHAGMRIPIVPFATLETRKEDLAALNESESPFIYFVGVRGTTGSSSNIDSSEISEKLHEIRTLTRKPIILGFGIKTRADADKALEMADGFVIGTEAVRRQEDPDLLEEYLRTII